MRFARVKLRVQKPNGFVFEFSFLDKSTLCLKALISN